MTYKVLLVDDETIVCDALSKFFPWKEYGYEVVGSASSVAEAINFLETHEVDLLLTDVRMPNQTGIDLLEIVNQEFSYIKTIILSGYSEFTYAQNALRLGALDYLTKPINFEDLKVLLLKLKSALEKKERESKLYEEYKRAKEFSVLLRVLKGEKGLESEVAEILFQKDKGILLRISPCNRLKDYQELNDIKKYIGEKLKTLFQHTVLLNNDVYELCVILFEDKTDELIEKLEYFICELKAEDIYLSIGLCESMRENQALAESYKKAGKALQYQKVRQSTGVLDFHQLDMIYSEEDGYETEKYAKLLLETITDPKEHPRLKEQLALIMDELEYLPDYSLDTLQIKFMQILIEVTNQLHNHSSQDWDLHKEFNQTLQLLLKCHNIKEVYDILVIHFEGIIRHIELVEPAKFLGTLINDVIQYLKEHYAEQVSLNVLAENFYVHPIYLSRLFKEKTGVNFIDFLTQIRMNKAKELLLSPELKIYDICFMVGYESPRYFSKIFKQYTMFTPKEYKENMEKCS